ncbi:hypothetical protein CAPGI0001_0090 [Capnocytophaga gingivalis ATCC 33624]|uniref:hypothetical protein n=1 Tax=Capnocytophaga gingivalis TaxID=1017 RepID=UPI00019FABC7|nr:hypothetical protein [Capnocytophaga gingivalis]EEK14196.1 hypothetical protein CAPGI0001_0090 [Capnocytophaga gingivalis ATCC 33624]
MDRKNFIRNPFSELNDSIRIDVLIIRIEKDAAGKSGLHYEVFHQKVMENLSDIVVRLKDEDAEKLKLAAAMRGYCLDEESLAQTRECYLNKIKQIEDELL